MRSFKRQFLPEMVKGAGFAEVSLTISLCAGLRRAAGSSAGCVAGGCDRGQSAMENLSCKQVTKIPCCHSSTQSTLNKNNLTVD